MPAVWVSADHQCILWCKQLVLSLARALFDSVDLRTKQLSVEPAPRQRAFSYHLLHVSRLYRTKNYSIILYINKLHVVLESTCIFVIYENYFFFVIL